VHAAEEAGDLGQRDQRAATNLATGVLEHLMPIEASTRSEPDGHWRKEIEGFSRDLDLELSPSIRAQLEQDLERLHLWPRTAR
jgi:hypothetical protein